MQVNNCHLEDPSVEITDGAALHAPGVFQLFMCLEISPLVEILQSPDSVRIEAAAAFIHRGSITRSYFPEVKFQRNVETA